MKHNSKVAAEVIEAVEQANQRFYRALENADLEAMSALWLHEDWVKCVHPGWNLIIWLQ